jgi:hypothetical protein
MKLEEFLIPYTEQDPITYDPNFILELDAIRAARYAAPASTEHNSLVKSQAKTIFGMGSSQKPGRSNQQLLTESIDDYTNSEILDLMQTYYKVSHPALSSPS